MFQDINVCLKGVVMVTLPHWKIALLLMAQRRQCKLRHILAMCYAHAAQPEAQIQPYVQADKACFVSQNAAAKSDKSQADVHTCKTPVPAAFSSLDVFTQATQRWFCLAAGFLCW